MTPPGDANPWMRKYIFPGGYTPALSEVLPRSRAAPGCGSPTSRSCACTTPRRCGTGASASRRNRDEAAALYDERFCRMWEFYLVAAEMASATRHMVFQMQLAQRHDAVPLTRDYIADFERAQRLGRR